MCCFSFPCVCAVDDDRLLIVGVVFFSVVEVAEEGWSLWVCVTVCAVMSSFELCETVGIERDSVCVCDCSVFLAVRLRWCVLKFVVGVRAFCV